MKNVAIKPAVATFSLSSDSLFISNLFPFLVSLPLPYFFWLTEFRSNPLPCGDYLPNRYLYRLSISVLTIFVGFFRTILTSQFLSDPLDSGAVVTPPLAKFHTAPEAEGCLTDVFILFIGRDKVANCPRK